MGEGKWITEKKVVYKTEVDQVLKNFIYYDDFFREVREDKKACDVCSSNYEEGQILHLAFVDRGDNKLICDDCFEKAEDSGVRVVENNEWIMGDD